MVSYVLTRSKRKTISIQITEKGVMVKAPTNCPIGEIEGFLQKKSDWISKNLAQMQQRADKKAAFSLNYGSDILLFGNNYPIVARQGIRTGFDSNCFYMPPGLTPDAIRNCCIKVYKILAKKCFTDRVYHFSQMMGVVPTAVKVNSAKTRWGSCSSAKSLNFSWRLAMAGDTIIDYVIVHELAHIYHMNHSPKFWATVEAVIPDYKACRAGLKELQQKLSQEDWG